jgi:predicted CopG family antitoxin
VIINYFKKKRKTIEGAITSLKLKRSEFVEQRLQDLGSEGEKTFSDAIRAIILKQLQEKGFDLSTSV